MFLLVVEPGELEGKARLLVESLREYGGAYRDAPIWAVQPRSGKRLARKTYAQFARQNVVFVHADLNQTWHHYPLANKPYASSFVEALVADSVRTLVLMDTDVLFLRPPDELLLDGAHSVAVRPVDEAHVGIGVEEPVNDFWSFVYEICGVDTQKIWGVEPFVQGNKIRAYFNSGLVAVRPSRGIFRRWRRNLEQAAIRRELRMAVASRPERWFLEQALFSGTLLGMLAREEVKLLNDSYNYPLHKQALLPAQRRLSSLADAAVVHYHQVFYGRSWRKEIEVPPPYDAWLRQRLPLPNFFSRVKHSACVRRFVAKPYHSIWGAVKPLL